MALSDIIPPNVLSGIQDIDISTPFGRMSDARLNQMFAEAVPRSRAFRDFRSGGFGSGMTMAPQGMQQTDADFALVDQWLRDRGLSFESLPVGQKRQALDAAARLNEKNRRSGGPLGFLTKPEVGIPLVLGGGLALGLSGAGAGAGGAGATTGSGAGTAASGAAAGSGNLLATGPLAGISSGTTQALATPAFAGGLGGGGALAAGAAAIPEITVTGSVPSTGGIGATAGAAGGLGAVNVGATPKTLPDISPGRLGEITDIAEGGDMSFFDGLGGSLLDIGKQAGGSLIGGLVGKGLNELFGPDTDGITGPLLDALRRAEQIPNLNAGGFESTREDGTLTVGSLAPRTAAVEGLVGEFGRGANQIAGLRGQVTPGFGRLTQAIEEGGQARLADLTSQRQRAVGNLRDNLGRRRILGSSFASDAISRAENEFSQQRDRVLADVQRQKAQSFLQELEMNTQLLQREQKLRQARFNARLQNLNLEAELGTRLATAGQDAFSQLSAALADANRLIAAGEMQSINTFAGIGSEVFS